MSDDDGDEILTPLHAAVDAGDLVRVQALLAAGADIEEIEELIVYAAVGITLAYATPLFRAAQKGDIAVARYLVERGANKEAKRLGGTTGHITSLIVAAEQGHTDVVQMLIEHGANKEAAYSGGWSPLISASARGHVAVVEYLLEQGCDVNHASSSRWTALHWAAGRGRFEVAQLLLRFGAKLDLRTKGGSTAADVATRNGHHDIANAIRAEEKWWRRRTAMFVAFKATVAKGTKQPLLARLRLECQDTVRLVVSFL